jgi:hypothetical protein
LKHGYPGRTIGWGRIAILIGIALSIAWTVFMLGRSSKQMLAHEVAIADEAKNSCESKTGQDCSKVRVRTYHEAYERDHAAGSLLPRIFEAMFPALVGWLIAYGIISVNRRVRRGWKMKRPAGI